MSDENNKFLSREPGRLDLDPSANETRPSTGRGPSTPVGKTLVDSNQTLSRDNKAAQAARSEQEPNEVITLGAPVPFPDANPGHLPGVGYLPASQDANKAKPPSREAYTQLKTSVETQLLTRCKEYCRRHSLGYQEFYNALLKSAFDQLERSGFPPVYPGTQTDPKPVYPGTQPTLQPPDSVYLGTQLARAKDLDLILDLESEEKIDQEKEGLIDRSIDLSSTPRARGESVYPGTQTDAETETAEQALLKETQALKFYEKKAGRKLSDYDQRAYRYGTTNDSGEYKNSLGQYTGSVADVPLHLIRRGILDSIERSKGRLGTFAYCLGAIHQAVEADRAEYKEWAVNRDEGLHRLRIKAEARAKQQTIPKVGPQLEFEKPTTLAQRAHTEHEAELAAFAAMSEEEQREKIRRDLGYRGPDARTGTE